MQLWFTFCTIWLTCFALVNASEFKVVCYFGSWSVYRTGNGNIQISDIDPTLCSHMIYAFVGLTGEGEVRVLDAWNDLAENSGKAGFQKFNAMRKRSSGTKTMVAIGGWNEGSITYSKVIGDSSLRSKFVKSVLNFTLHYGFDGFDIDWEYPNQRGGVPEDVENFVLLLKELRTVFDKNGLLLSAAVGAGKSSASLSYDIPRISEYLHFINLMTYDFHGSWDSTIEHNAPLYHAERETTDFEKSLNVNASVHYWLDQGASAHKLVLGTGLYGRSFTLANSAQNTPGSMASGPGQAGPYTRENGMLGYNEICELEAQGSWTSAWDQEQRVPYAFSGNQWVSYDNVESITEKAKYAKSLGLGGAMVWSIETDDFRGICGEKYPLLKALNRVLRDGDSVPIPTSPSTVTATSESIEESEPPATSGSDNETTDDPDQESNIICLQSHDNYFRDHQNCAKFWICQKTGDNYKAMSFVCPDGLYFDNLYKVCNFKELVDC